MMNPSGSSEPYVRLPGRARRCMGVVSSVVTRLWLASDHLLYVQSSAYSQTYKRFYLTDIQAVVITRTRAHVVANIVIASLFLLVVLPVLLLAPWEATVITSAILLLILGPFLIVNLVSGPTCKCVLHTAVQAETLHCLGRLRTARRVFGVLRPLIEAAQGPALPEESALDAVGQEVLQASTHVTPRASHSAAVQAPIRHEHGTIHAWMFWLVAAATFSYAFDIFHSNEFKNNIDMLWALGIIALAMVALFRQKNSDLPISVRRLTGFMLCLKAAEFVAFLFVGIVIGMFVAIDSKGDQQAILAAASTFTRTPPFVAYVAVAAMVSGIVGYFGLTRLYAFRRSHARAQALQPSPEPSVRPFSGREL